MSTELVSIVSPVYNEQAVIVEFIQRCLAVADSLAQNYRFEVVLVNDGSTDNSLKILRQQAALDSRIKVVELMRNYGQAAALQAGLDSATGEIVITLDSDLQHFPEEIPAFLAKLEEDYDLVCGWRHQRAEGVMRRFPSRVANWLIRRVSGVDLHDFGTTFRACRSRTLDDLRLFGEFHRFVPALLKNAGGRVTEIPIRNIVRPAGVSNYGLGRTIGVFLDLFVLYFFTHYLDRPMRAFGTIALAAISGGMTILLTMLIGAHWTGQPLFSTRPGWFILGSMLLLVGLQLILVGILAEILVRIHYDHGNRRVYRIR
ncbi:glycosyltransferase family 2 protein [bacterium]|nr:glycosyltransferase family 2 protein [bacterium]